jgi:membrane protein YfhO
MLTPSHAPLFPRLSASLWPYLFVTLAPLILFAPFLLGRQVLYWGAPLLQFYPWRQFALEMIRAGRLPLWNPGLGNGAPLVANYQSAIFYPPNWLSLLLPLDYSLSWLVALHLVWAGAGMVTLARALGLKPLGQVTAGLAFGMSQYLVARAGFFSINAAVAWLPWIIWLGDQLLVNAQYAISPSFPLGRSTQIRTALLLSLFLAFQLLAGHAQTTWYTLLLLGAWTIWRLFTPAPLLFVHPKSTEDGARASLATRSGHLSFRHLTFDTRSGHSTREAVIFLLSFAIFLAFALAALQLLPTAELLRESPRAVAADYEFVVTYSFSPWRLLTLFAPDLLGNPAHGQFYGYGNYWEDAVYVGILPVLLALGVVLQSLISPLRRLFTYTLTYLHTSSPSLPDSSAPLPPITRHASLVTFLTLLLPVTFLLATGRNTPIFPFFYRYVPTFDLFQAPARMMIWFVFALTLLAGIGADRWFGGQPLQGRALYWTRLSTVGAVTVTITSLVVLLAVPPVGKLAQQLDTVARAVALTGIGLFLSIILSLLKPKALAHSPLHPGALAPSLPHLWELSVALFLSADLIFAGYGLNPGAPPDLYRAPTASGAALSPAIGGHRLFQFPGDEYHVKFDLLFSFKTFGPPALARAARETQLPNVALLDGLASVNDFDPLVSARYARLVGVISDTQAVNLLPLMDVAAVVSSAPVDREVIYRGDTTTMVRVPGDVRRVRVVYSARTVADAGTALAAVTAPEFDPATAVVLEADDPGARANHSITQSPVTQSLTASPNAVTIPVSLRQPGWVVLSDTYYPGWFVFVDGRPATLLHADFAFRAVAVEAGDHVVVFRYEPRSFQIGLWVSAASWLIWVGLAFWLWRRKRGPVGE